MTKGEKGFLAVLFIVVISVLTVTLTPVGRFFFNTNLHAVQKVDDATNYKTRKQVEDTCRSMIASYKYDVLTYEQYKDSDSEEKQSWAEQAKMRANKTAMTYNEYILKNRYVWEGNVPEDIDSELEIVQ